MNLNDINNQIMTNSGEGIYSQIRDTPIYNRDLTVDKLKAIIKDVFKNTTSQIAFIDDGYIKVYRYNVS
jgi:hypothetical protein